MLNAAEEIRFWTGIMSNHGEFILNSLSYNEQESIQHAKHYRDTFAGFHEQSGMLAETNDLNTLNTLVSACFNLLSSFINFKKVLLARLLQCKLNTSLTPTFYNHMINEAMEFYKVLLGIYCNAQANPLQENLNLHLIWLPDAAGHAAIIASDLDPLEKMLINEAMEFEKCFNCLYIKADELSKMLMRTCLQDGALKLLNEQVQKKMEEFILYLGKIRKLTVECRVLGVLKPITPDHMIREEIYYLSRLKSAEQGK